MIEEEFLKKLEDLDSVGTLDSYDEIIKLIDELLEKINNNKEKSILENKKVVVNIKKVKLKLEQLAPGNYKEEINLRGKIISLYKQLEKDEKDQKKKFQIKHEIINELKKHKECISKCKKSKDAKISIPSKVGFNILEISKSIEIFMKEKDILAKIKNMTTETVAGASSIASIIGVVSFLLPRALGIPFLLSSIVQSMPVIAYIGLAAIIRNLSNKTPFEQFEYQQSDEFKIILKEFNEKNKQCLSEVTKILKQKEDVTNNEDVVLINEQLIEKIDSLINNTNVRVIKDSYALQVLSFLRESKECCELIINDYMDEKNNDVEKYKEYNKKLSNIKFEIFKRGNSFKESFIDAGKGIYNNAKVMLIAKTILSFISPNVFSLNSEAILKSFSFILINGLIDIPTYRNKLKFKETEYQGKIKVKNKKRIEEILNIETSKPKLA